MDDYEYERVRGISEASVQTTESFILDEEVQDIMRNLEDFRNSCIENSGARSNTGENNENNRDNNNNSNNNNNGSNSNNGINNSNNNNDNNNDSNNDNSNDSKNDYNNNINNYNDLSSNNNNVSNNTKNNSYHSCEKNNGNHDTSNDVININNNNCMSYKENIDFEQHQETENEECLKLYDDSNIYYIRKGDIERGVDEKRRLDEVKRREYSFNTYDAVSLKRSNRKWRYVSYILTILILMLMFVSLWEFTQIQDIKTRLLMLKPTEAKKISPNKVPQTARIVGLPPSKMSSIPPKEFTAISLTGNDQFQMGHQDLPIGNWELHYQHGKIDFEQGTMIKIKQSGLYQLYAQMFFFQNGRMFAAKNSTKQQVMDFGVRNFVTNDRIISATVSLSSCLESCTRHISSYVLLQEGATLIVDTATPGVWFKMIRAKTLFGAYMVDLTYFCERKKSSK